MNERLAWWEWLWLCVLGAFVFLTLAVGLALLIAALLGLVWVIQALGGAL